MGELEIPQLSQEDAELLISNANVAISCGEPLTNSKKKSRTECGDCGFKFATRSFNYCPVCAIGKAQHVNLQDTSGSKQDTKKTIDVLIKYSLIVIGILITWWALFQLIGRYF